MDGTNADDANDEVAWLKPTPVPDGPAAAAFGAAAETNGCGGEEEVDDEQVERFYALLANIRAMRRAYTPGAGDDAAAGGSGARKRLRSAEPPWRPAFRLEDFEDATTATSARKKEGNRSAVPDDEEKKVVAPPRSGARRFDANSKSID